MSWEKELAYAVHRRDLSRVDIILCRSKKGDLVRDLWHFGSDPLHLAAANGTNEIVKGLVLAGVNVNSYVQLWDDKEPERISRAYQWTALHAAVQNNHVETVSLLLELGADTSLEGDHFHKFKGTPWDWANSLAGAEEIRRLLEKKISSTVYPSCNEIDHSGGQKMRQRVTKRVEPLNKHFSTNPFEVDSTMQNIIERVEAKKAKEEMLAKAMTIRGTISLKEERVEALDAEKTKEVEDIKVLKSDKDFMTDEDIEELQNEIKYIEDLASAVQKSLEPTDKKIDKDFQLCPVCSLMPKKIFSCFECDNWVCQACQEELLYCPSCREDLKMKPFRRNRGIEKALQITPDN